MLFLVIALRQFHGKNSLKKSSWLKGCAHCNIRRICYLTYITVLMITLIDWTWPSLHLFCVLKSFPCWIKWPTFCPSNCKNVFEIKQITPSLWLISYTVTPRSFPPLWSGSIYSENNWSFKNCTKTVVVQVRPLNNCWPYASSKPGCLARLYPQICLGYVEFMISGDEFSVTLETRAANLLRGLFANVVSQRINLSTCGQSAINVANISSELMSFSDTR